MKLKSLFLIPALAQMATAAYVRHDNPAGFRVEHPEGWVVEMPRSQTIVIRSRNSASFVVIHGFVDRNRRSADWVSQAFQRGFSPFPNAMVARVVQQESRPDIVLASL